MPGNYPAVTAGFTRVERHGLEDDPFNAYFVARA